MRTTRFYIILKLLILNLFPFLGFSTIRFYIILKRRMRSLRCMTRFSTIRFYIILKRVSLMLFQSPRFSTIRFYIILKLHKSYSGGWCVSVPYVFTSFSNREQMRKCRPTVSVPYVFTSFSNLKFKNEPPSFAQNKVLKHI